MSTKNERDDEVEIFSEATDIIEIILGAIAHDPIALAKLTAVISDKAFTTIQRIPYIQIQKYIDGVKAVEDDLGGACKLCEKLFSNPKTRNDNAIRVYKMVTATDTTKKIDLLIDTTRSMLLGLIDVEMMYRIFRAIVETMPEDLQYLSSIVEKEGPFKGNIRVHALSRVGLMISAGIDAEADVEEQEYHVSSLGYAVDRYALSANDEEREKWYQANRAEEVGRKFVGPSTATDEELRAMMEATFEEQKHEIIGATTPKWQGFNTIEDKQNKAIQISAKKEAVVVLVCATKSNGEIIIGQDISHSNPYVEIGNIMLPSKDDARNSAAWIGAVRLLENLGMIECVNTRQKIYKLTDDGWDAASIYIEENGFSDEQLLNPVQLLQSINE